MGVVVFIVRLKWNINSYSYVIFSHIGSRRIKAHRLVLSAASDYFAAMFTSPVLEATQEEVAMRDMDADALHTLVNYCYTGVYCLLVDSYRNNCLPEWFWTHTWCVNKYPNYILMYHKSNYHVQVIYSCIKICCWSLTSGVCLKCVHCFLVNRCTATWMNTLYCVQT